MDGTDAEAVGVGIGMNAAAECNLGAGARRRRDGDVRGHVFGDFAGIQQVVDDGTVMGGGDAQRFAGIQDRAAAEGDDAVAIIGVVYLQRGDHAGDSGIFRYVVEQSEIVAPIQGVAHKIQNAVFDQPLVGDDQGPLDAKRFQLFGQRLNGAEFENNLGETVHDVHGICLVP